jgi:hypothetical protein
LKIAKGISADIKHGAEEVLRGGEKVRRPNDSTVPASDVIVKDSILVRSLNPHTILCGKA